MGAVIKVNASTPSRSGASRRPERRGRLRPPARSRWPTTTRRPPAGPGCSSASWRGAPGGRYLDRSARRRRHDVLECLARYFGPRARRPTAYHDMVWARERYTRGAYGTLQPAGRPHRASATPPAPVPPAHCTSPATGRAPAGPGTWTARSAPATGPPARSWPSSETASYAPARCPTRSRRTTSSAPRRRARATTGSPCSCSSRCSRSSTPTGSATATLEIEPVGDGHSNVTYLVAPRRTPRSSCAARPAGRCRRAPTTCCARRGCSARSRTRAARVPRVLAVVR